jgi:hypothetical protein
MDTTSTNQTERMLEQLDPSTVAARDATGFRRIIAARDNLARAERELHEAVAAAREAGDSWTAIGTALGITKQAAQQRFHTTRHR